MHSRAQKGKLIFPPICFSLLIKYPKILKTCGLVWHFGSRNICLLYIVCPKSVESKKDRESRSHARESKIKCASLRCPISLDALKALFAK